MNIRNEIRDLVSEIQPLDEIERQHINYVMDWLKTNLEIFRIEKPANPPIHLVSYFLVFSPDQSQVLLVDHKKAELWLPPGGHVEINENPKDTVKREAKEKLGIETEFIFEKPLFLTVTETVGNVTQHTDVSLWYAIKWKPEDSLIYDKEEFNQIQWLGIEEMQRLEDLDKYLKSLLLVLKKQCYPLENV